MFLFFSQPFAKVKNVFWDKVNNLELFILDALGRHRQIFISGEHQLIGKHVWNFMSQAS